MIDYIKFLNIPTKIAIAIVAIFLFTQLIGEILEAKGKIVPEVVKVRKYFARKKQERATLSEVQTTLAEVKQTLNEVNIHYNTDNITMRDNWMHDVDCKQEQDHAWIQKLDEKLDGIIADTLELKVENKRETIINFAARVIDEQNPVTREQFNRVFKLYQEYEDIIESNGLTNGEVDVAYRIITESYENHMRNRSFIEDLRGYSIQE